MASSSKNQTKLCSSVFGKVRVVGRIRGFSHQELASDGAHSSSIVSVCKSGDSEKVKLSFDDQLSSRKNEYEVDYCYGQNEDTAVMFLKEIKPRISKLFDGESSTFIAFGARDSGKTYTIQGSEENQGLGMLAMDEILKIVEEGTHEVAISIYEVFQNHVYDLLDSKNPEVYVLEDAQGKIKLKGLSKVHVKSISEFQKLYFSGSSLNKPIQKIKLELPRKSHKALMIHILAREEGGNPKCVGKMNFIDLAGYENLRRNSIDGTNLAESTNINKSLNSLLNVIHAINANESRVPYRESILARVLQDSLGRNNHISMLVCLNPLFCPDTIHAAALASRLKSIKPVAVSSAKKQPNLRVPLSANKTSSSVAVSTTKKAVSTTKKAVSTSKEAVSTTKKQTNSRVPLSAKKTNVVIKGRKLFGGTEQASGIKEKVPSKANNPSNNVVTSDIPDGDSTVIPYVREEKCSSDGALDGALVCSDAIEVASTGVPCPAAVEIAKSDVTQEMELVVTEKEEAEVMTHNNCPELIPLVNDNNLEKENNSFLGQSPPSVGLQKLLSRLQSLELKNRMQALESSTPLSIISSSNDANTEVVNFVDTTEPKTPIVTNKIDFSNCPSGAFSKRSSGMKHSLVKDYLQFLNSASKDDLKEIPGIGEKRAGYILELREDSPEPFKSLDDLQDIGMSAKQVKTMMKNVAVKYFS